jgi:hypothetical protein
MPIGEVTTRLARTSVAIASPIGSITRAIDLMRDSIVSRIAPRLPARIAYPTTVTATLIESIGASIGEVPAQIVVWTEGAAESTAGWITEAGASIEDATAAAKPDDLGADL